MTGAAQTRRTSLKLTGRNRQDEIAARTNAVIDAFAAKSGSTIKAFLVANDLWSLDLEKASKVDRIATGLARARAQDRLERVLKAAEDVLGHSKGEFSPHLAPTLTNPIDQDTVASHMANTNTQIVVSHASADVEVVRALVELLRLGCNVPRERIICTSIPGMGVPQGEPFTTWIRDRVRSAALIVAVITPSYYDSVFCCCELGAWWALEKPLLPLLVPPLGYGDLQAVLTGVQAALVTNRADLDSLYDHVRQALALGPGSTPNWSEARDRFLVELEGIVERVAPSPKVPRDALDAVRLEGDEGSRHVPHQKSGTPTVSRVGVSGIPATATHSGQDVGFFGWTGSPTRVWSIRPDGTGAASLTDPGEAADPDWTRDGSRIVFSRWSGPRGPAIGPNRRIVVLSLSTGQRSELTDATWDDHQPVWSPAGDEVAFIRSDPGVNNHHVAGVSLPSGDQWPLTPAVGSGQLLATDPTWSPDGSRIMFWGQGWKNPGQRIYVVNADGSGFRDMVGLQNAVQPSWAPNGQRIAFIHEGRLCVADAGGHDLRRLDGPFPTTGTPRWHPDSTAVTVSGGGAEGSTPGIYVVPMNGPRRLVANTSPSSYDAGDSEPSFDETGELVVFTGTDGRVWISDGMGMAVSRIVELDIGRAIRPRFVSRMAS